MIRISRIAIATRPFVRGYSTPRDEAVISKKKEETKVEVEEHFPSPHEHAPKWSEDDATVSEATAKAEQSEHTSFDHLVEKTKEFIKKV